MKSISRFDLSIIFLRGNLFLGQNIATAKITCETVYCFSFFKFVTFRGFPHGPVVKTLHFHRRVQVQSLVKEVPLVVRCRQKKKKNHHFLVTILGTDEFYIFFKQFLFENIKMKHWIFVVTFYYHYFNMNIWAAANLILFC